MFFLLFLFSFFFYSLPSAASSSDSISLYCTSNKDGTGLCFDESGLNQFQCLIVPGSIVPCKNLESLATIWCIYIGDSQFNCKKKKDLVRMQDVSSHILGSNLDNIPDSMFQDDTGISASPSSGIDTNSLPPSSFGNPIQSDIRSSP